MHWYCMMLGPVMHNRLLICPVSQIVSINNNYLMQIYLYYGHRIHHNSDQSKSVFLVGSNVCQYLHLHLNKEAKLVLILILCKTFRLISFKVNEYSSVTHIKMQNSLTRIYFVCLVS